MGRIRRWICASVTLIAIGIGVASVGAESACAPIPSGNCRGDAVNAKLDPNGQPDDHCSECMEAKCCDLVGDCQSNECAGQVTKTHECVVDAGRRAAVAESKCKADGIGTDPETESSKVYACMRASCGESCALPTCKLEPLVPPLGRAECDHCFAQSCCPLMNECANNRTCLLILSCIVNECRDELVTELATANHAEALRRANETCTPGRAFPDSGALPTNCFVRCIAQTIVDGNEEADRARCLAARIAECGSDVPCGDACAAGRDGGIGAAADAASDSSSDASIDAPSDGPSE